MIESSSRIIKFLQRSKSVILPVLYLLFALLFLCSSSGVFIDHARTNRGYSASGKGSYILMQNSALNVPAHIISYDANPYPYHAIGTGAYATGNLVDVVHKAYTAGERSLIVADGKHAESISPSAVKSADMSSDLVAFMLTWGNESVHINWSPLSSFFEPRFISLMADFSSALARITPKPLLTTAAAWGVLTVRPAVELLYKQQNRNQMTSYEISAPLPGLVICRSASSM